MNYQQYNNLDPQGKIHIWETLRSNAGWQILEDIFSQEELSPINEKTSKDEFLYNAIRRKTLEEVFREPIKLSAFTRYSQKQEDVPPKKQKKPFNWFRKAV